MLDWLYTAIAWVMKEWHAVFATFLDPAGGLSWALSIVFLVITIRVLLFRLFIRQVKSQRAMQELQPEIQKLRKQYGSDKQGFSQAMMALQKERGVNPLAGCLPIVPQIPVFIALFHVLRRLAPGKPGLYSWTTELTQQAATAKLFGAPISSSINMTGSKQHAILQIATYTNIRIVCAVLIVIMVITSFMTQKQIQRKSGPVEGQAAMVQKLMLYGMPLGLLVSSSFFPIGVLLYWFTNNLWTLGQQMFILRKMPPPGSPAALAKKADEDGGIDPKSLAPRPGAKPIRDRSGRPVAPKQPFSPTAEPADKALPDDGGKPTGTGKAGDKGKPGDKGGDKGKAGGGGATVNLGKQGDGKQGHGKPRDGGRPTGAEPAGGKADSASANGSGKVNGTPPDGGRVNGSPNKGASPAGQAQGQTQGPTQSRAPRNKRKRR